MEDTLRYAETSLRVMNDKSANGGAGFLFHDLALFVMSFLPKSITQSISLKMHRTMRSKAYVKYQMTDPLKKKE